MRTTIELPDGLFLQAKTMAVQKKQSLKEFFTAALEQAVAEPPRTARRMERPPIAGFSKKPIPARSNADLAELLADEEEGKGL